MFDPTVYENLKVVLEGAAYEQDFNGEILITNREDSIDLATMSRKYSFSFQLKHRTKPTITATISLHTAAKDLYGEILELEKNVGCSLFIDYQLPLKDTNELPHRIQEHILEIWENRPTVSLRISYEWRNDGKINPVADVHINFNRSINESHIDDLPEIIHLAIQTSIKLEQIAT